MFPKLLLSYKINNLDDTESVLWHKLEQEHRRQGLKKI